MQKKTNKKKKALVGVLSAAILSSAILPGTSAFAATDTPTPKNTPVQNLANNTPSKLTPQDIRQQEQLLRAIDQRHALGIKQTDKNEIGPATFIRKIITNALRYGGPYMGKLVGKLNAKAGKWVSDKSWAIANMLEGLESWELSGITAGLLYLGCPPDIAPQIAQAILYLLPW
ncbi:hypothetical protein J2N67_006354 (plasmid) [Bacillus thuringiensis]|uniref:hypothetical protein n=1 Tax=Bacillus thuringiensis TaxID=1428 RepID=UPI00208EE2E4|nr:hypothetical protein [Bacillus thuringiensis]USP56105.1 hypothetical protein J2N67_006354 [Bacillus thuringiensis]